jgi:hypothetical protein
MNEHLRSFMRRYRHNKRLSRLYMSFALLLALSSLPLSMRWPIFAWTMWIAAWLLLVWSFIAKPSAFARLAKRKIEKEEEL